jgi:hypothetical protein
VGGNMLRGTLFYLAFVACLLWAAPVEAMEFNFLALWGYRTTDSGVGEDQFSFGDNGGYTPAQGARVTVLGQNGFSQSYYLDEQGRLTFNTALANAPFTLRFRSKSRDTEGNVVRIHDDAGDTTSPYGAEYEFFVYGYTPNQQAGVYDLVLIQGETQMATATAMSGYILERNNAGLDDMTLHVGLATGNCDFNSAHFKGKNGGPWSNAAITSGLHHVALGKCPTQARTRMKFVIGHELGHALLALYYGKLSTAVNGHEPGSWGSTFKNYAGAAEAGCADEEDSYWIDSAEYSGLAFREGFAHYVSARTFNDKWNNASGVLNWWNDGAVYDLETHQWANPSNEWGGLMRNQCCIGAYCGNGALNSVSTIGDWMRALWDMYTNTYTCCGDTMGNLEMFKLYRLTRDWMESFTGYEWEPWLSLTLTMDNTGADHCLVDTSPCGMPRVEHAGRWNGIHY